MKYNLDKTLQGLINSSKDLHYGSVFKEQYDEYIYYLTELKELSKMTKFLPKSEISQFFEKFDQTKANDYSYNLTLSNRIQKVEKNAYFKTSSSSELCMDGYRNSKPCYIEFNFNEKYLLKPGANYILYSNEIIDTKKHFAEIKQDDYTMFINLVNRDILPGSVGTIEFFVNVSTPTIIHKDMIFAQVYLLR